MGSQRIADIAAISYHLVEQILPIYGYASRTYDDMSRGTRMVTGQIMVPYTGPYSLLRQIENMRPFDPSSQLPPTNEDRPYHNIDRDEIENWALNLQRKYWGDPKGGVVEDTFFPTQPIRIHIRFADDPARDRILDGVHLQAVGGGADPSGEAVLETYAFQARDILKNLSRST